MRLSLKSPEGQAALLNTVVQPIWDEANIALTNAGVTNLFATGTASRNLLQTNLGLPGQISAPDYFILRGFMIATLPRESAAGGYVAGVISGLQDIADWQRFLHCTIFRFTVGSALAPIVYGHAALFPAGIGVQGMVTSGGATTTNYAYIAGNGIRDLSNRYSLGQDYAEMLRAGEQFRGSYEWPITVSMSASFTARCYLTGFWSQGVH